MRQRRSRSAQFLPTTSPRSCRCAGRALDGRVCPPARAGRLRIFPGDDGARNSLARWLDRSGPLDCAGIQAAVRRWQPFAGFVDFYLLLANLAGHGNLSENSSV